MPTTLTAEQLGQAITKATDAAQAARATAYALQTDRSAWRAYYEATLEEAALFRQVIDRKSDFTPEERAALLLVALDTFCRAGTVIAIQNVKGVA